MQRLTSLSAWRISFMVKNTMWNPKMILHLQDSIFESYRHIESIWSHKYQRELSNKGCCTKTEDSKDKTLKKKKTLDACPPIKIVIKSSRFYLLISLSLIFLIPTTIYPRPGYHNSYLDQCNRLLILYIYSCTLRSIL